MSTELHREVYCRQIIGRLQQWESQLAYLRADIWKLDGDARLQCETWLREIEACKRNVVKCYADLLLADNKTWDEKRVALDTAADELEGVFIDFAMQAASPLTSLRQAGADFV